METGHENGSSKHSQIPPEATTDKGERIKLGKKSSSSSSSSSSNSSFDEDFFLLDESAPRKSSVGITGPLKFDESAHLALDGKKDVPTAFGSPDMGSLGSISSPGMPALTPEPSLHSKSPQQSPPVQVMERSDVPDPYRIPSTVFARTKSTTPVEWSVASNESLFSIHMGNNSFSRDQIFLMGRSGELGKSGELFTLPNTMSGELMMNFPNNLSPASTAVVNPEKKSSDLGENLGVAEAAAETMKEVLRATAEDRNKESTPPAEGTRLSSSVSHRSDGSGASIVSFAFPILTGEGNKSVSVKVEPEQQPQQQPQPQTLPGTVPVVTDTKWFSCFACSFCR